MGSVSDRVSFKCYGRSHTEFASLPGLHMWVGSHLCIRVSFVWDVQGFSPGLHLSGCKRKGARYWGGAVATQRNQEKVLPREERLRGHRRCTEVMRLKRKIISGLASRSLVMAQNPDSTKSWEWKPAFWGLSCVWAGAAEGEAASLNNRVRMLICKVKGVHQKPWQNRKVHVRPRGEHTLWRSTCIRLDENINHLYAQLIHMLDFPCIFLQSPLSLSR